MLYQSEAVGIVDNADEVSLVCTRANGKPVLYFNIEHLLKREGLNAHSFRHTHATLLILNGATPKGVSSRLGHSSVVITQDLYTHVTSKMSEDTAAVFSKIMQTNP